MPENTHDLLGSSAAPAREPEPLRYHIATDEYSHFDHDGKLWIGIELTPADLKRHALLIGSTGCGKTTAIHHLIEQDILLEHSFCVLDLRGDLVASTLELCAARVLPERVKIIDLREKERPMGFDPLFGAGEPYFRALQVLDAIASVSDSWGVQIAETLRNALMLLAEANERLTAIESIFFDRAFRLQCLTACTEEPVLSFWQRYGELSADRQAALAAPVLNKVSILLATKTLRRMLGHERPIELGPHLNTPGSVTLISLAIDEMHSAGKILGQLVLAAVCREVFSRVSIPEAERNPVRLYVDEFEHFGMAEFETFLAEGRRFGLALLLAHQTMAQLTPKMRAIILGNVGVKLVFQCGYEDSVFLSRHLTADPDHFWFDRFEVGEAVLWRSGHYARFIEILPPILKNRGTVSAKARKFIDQVYAAHEASYPARPAVTPAAPSAEAGGSTLPASPLTHLDAPGLGDWLCD